MGAQAGPRSPAPIALAQPCALSFVHGETSLALRESSCEINPALFFSSTLFGVPGGQMDGQTDERKEGKAPLPPPCPSPPALFPRLLTEHLITLQELPSPLLTDHHFPQPE